MTMDGIDFMFTLLGGMMILWAIVLIIALVFIILSCAAHYKMFKLLGYSHPIAAWIPFWSSYAIADLVVGEEKEMPMLGLKVPGTLFKFYWAIAIACGFIPVIGSIVSFILNGICLGVCYGWIYSALEGREYDDCKVLGMLSGFIGIIATVKFLAAKKG